MTKKSIRKPIIIIDNAPLPDDVIKYRQRVISLTNKIKTIQRLHNAERNMISWLLKNYHYVAAVCSDLIDEQVYIMFGNYFVINGKRRYHTVLFKTLNSTSDIMLKLKEYRKELSGLQRNPPVVVRIRTPKEKIIKYEEGISI